VLKHQLIHPKINEIIGRAGHHSLILIADGNYPASTKKGPNAELVCMNLTPGLITCTQALQALLSAVPIDRVSTMGIPADDPYARRIDEKRSQRGIGMHEFDARSDYLYAGVAGFAQRRAD
jgi:L-fucose mutarotase